MANTRTNKEKLYDVIKKPLITEKSMMAVQNGQYTFEVVKDATKVEIAQAIELAYPDRKVKKSKNGIYALSPKKTGYEIRQNTIG